MNAWKGSGVFFPCRPEEFSPYKKALPGRHGKKTPDPLGPRSPAGQALGGLRKAISLVELLAVMAVGSAVVGVTVAMLHTVLRAEAVARQRLQTRATVSLLAGQFRSDAHAAVSLVAIGEDGSADKPQWRFVLGPDHDIRYTLQTGELLREESIDGAVRQREVFVLPEETGLAIEPPSQLDEMATVRVFALPEASEGAVSVRIEAWLGMDHRFADKAEARP